MQRKLNNTAFQPLIACYQQLISATDSDVSDM